MKVISIGTSKGNMGRDTSQTHVVFGATGSLGAATVRRLAALGISTRAVVRSRDRAKQLLPQQSKVAIGRRWDERRKCLCIVP